MAYKEWIALEVKATDYPLTIQGASVSWGKFYQYPNKDVELSAAQINGLRVEPGKSVIIAACGRSCAASGTEGRLEVHHDEAGKLSGISWNCPWSLGRTLLYVSSGCVDIKGDQLEWCTGHVDEGGVYYTSIGNVGALGNITLTYYSPHLNIPFGWR